MSEDDLTKAIYNIANVLQSYDRRNMTKDESFDLVFATCQLVARAEGFRFYSLPKKSRSADMGKEVENLASFSHIQSRKIKLPKNWDVLSNAPFVGYQAAENGEKKLVAVIQNAREKYEIHNLESGTVELVNNENKGTIKKEAWVFYRPLSFSQVDFKNLFSFLFTNLKEVKTLLFLTLMLSFLGLIFSSAIGQMIDTVLPFGTKNHFLLFSGFLFLIALISAGFNLNQSFVLSRIVFKIDSTLIPAIWDRLLKLPVSFFRQFQPGDLMLRVYSIVEIRSIFLTFIQHSLIVLKLSLYLIFIFIYMDHLFYSLMIFSVFYFLFCLVFSYVLTKNSFQMITLNGKISNMMLQFISGIYKLKSTCSIGRGYKKWSEIYAKKEQISFANQIILGFVDAINDLAFVFMTLLFFVFTLNKSVSNFDIGLILVVFYLYEQAVLHIIDLVDSIMVTVESAYPEIKRIKPLFTTKTEISNMKSFTDELTGKIEINQVTFSYSAESPLILNKLSCQIQPGEFIGITGGSGSGKSTLLRLLLGFEQTNSGSIYYDGNDVKEIDMTAVRRQIGVVLQNSQLIAGSIFQNIVGSLPYTLDDAWEVAKLCGLDKDIEQMPMGMHTWICEGAYNISSGQRQLILLARAFITKPKIMILDEATSTLDNQVQNLVIESLAKFPITRIVIAHRLSTLKKTHRIFVLRGGEIIEEGPYQTLIKNEGYFAQLAKQQHIAEE